MEMLKHFASVAAVDVALERVRQDEIWGGDRHDSDHGRPDWADFIEERTKKLRSGHTKSKRARELFVHIAALAIAAIETMDKSDA